MKNEPVPASAPMAWNHAPHNPHNHRRNTDLSVYEQIGWAHKAANRARCPAPLLEHNGLCRNPAVRNQRGANMNSARPAVELWAALENRQYRA